MIKRSILETDKYYQTAYFTEISGTFPEKQSSLKADITFLSYSNQRIDLRPSFGFSQFWGKTEGENSSELDLDPQGFSALELGVMKRIEF